MISDTKITGQQFMMLFNKATAVDYAGMYMSIQDDDEKFIFLPICSGESKISFNKEIVKCGVFVNRFRDMFRFDTEECEWFGLLSQIILPEVNE